MQQFRFWLLSNRLLIALIFSANLPLCLDQAMAAPVEDVRGAFHAAKQEFDKKNFTKAKQQFQAIVKKYPDHEPSLIHLGKIFFMEKNYNQAYKYFSNVSPVGQDPETAYEMGLVAVNRGQLQEGIQSLKTIPPGHQQYDVANFYAGRSALRLKQYTAARDYLKNATILPDTLAEQRRVYLEHINRVLQMREQAVLKKDLESEKERLNQNPAKPVDSLKPPPSPQSQQIKKQPEPPTQKPAANTQPHWSSGTWPREVYAFSQSTNVFIAREHQELEYELGGRKRYDVDITGLQVHAGPDYKFAHQADGRAGRLAFEIDLRADQRVRRGQHERLIGVEDDADLEYFISDDPDVKREQFGRVHLKPFFEWPLLPDASIGVHAQYSFVFPNFDKSKGAGTRGLGSQLKYWISDLEIAGAFDFKEALDQDSRRYFNVYEASLEGRWLFSHGLWLGALFDYEGYRYFKVDLDGPDQLYGIYAQAGLQFPLNFELGGQVGIMQYSNYIYHGVDRLKEISAGGVNYNGNVFFKAKPISFLAFEAEYTFSDTYWDIASQNQDDLIEFRANVPVTAGQLFMKGMLVFDF